MSKLDPAERTALERILEEPVLQKAVHLALAEVGEALDNTNSLSMERSAMAYQAEYGARLLVRAIFAQAGVKKNPQITTRRLKPVTV